MEQIDRDIKFECVTAELLIMPNKSEFFLQSFSSTIIWFYGDLIVCIEHTGQSAETHKWK